MRSNVFKIKIQVFIMNPLFVSSVVVGFADGLVGSEVGSEVG